MASSRYGTRTEVYVPLGSLNYGFKTNMDDGVRAVLGHITLDRNAPPNNLILGANKPKPGRATKTTLTEANSSFYNSANRAALIAAGWRLSNPKFRAGKGDRLARATEVYVTLSGVKYAWAMSDEVIEQMGGALASLGINPTSGSERDYVFGASFPKPPIASKLAANGISRVSTQYDPSISALPSGWSQVKSGVDSFTI
jgi:hypothetical protein